MLVEYGNVLAGRRHRPVREGKTRRPRGPWPAAAPAQSSDGHVPVPAC